MLAMNVLQTLSRSEDMAAIDRMLIRNSDCTEARLLGINSKRHVECFCIPRRDGKDEQDTKRSPVRSSVFYPIELSWVGA